MKGRLYEAVWYTAVAVSVVGVIVFSINPSPLAILIIAFGAGSLALFAIWKEIQLALSAEPHVTRRLVLVSGEAALFIIAVAFSTNFIPSDAPLSIRTAVLVLGVQVLALTIDTHPAKISQRTRWTIFCTGHGAVLAGTILILPFGPTNTTGTLLLYAVGTPTLLLHAFWIRTYREVGAPVPKTDAQRWEAILLVVIAVGVPAALFVSLTGTETALVPSTPIATSATAVAGVSAIVAFALLSAPETPPSITRLLDGYLVAVGLHTAVALILVNTFVFTVFLLLPQLFVWILGAVLLLVLVGVGLNYSMIWHAEKSLAHIDDDSEVPSPDIPLSAVTVIVSGFDEASVLPTTLQQNLANLPDMPFLLVPASRSTDGTIEIMQQTQQEHPERVQVIEGPTRSKAGDLNHVWRHVETPYVLVLDADETVDAEFVYRGLSMLRDRPSVGVVQGRKLAAYPTGSVFNRFVTIERQHSTLLDHSLLSDLFDAGHFGGSAAIFRREVPCDVGGWDPTFLTEDIELTLRLYLHSEWQVAYNPRMTAREINPQSWGALFRQRERWARGWAQVAIQHGPAVLQSGSRLGWLKSGALSWVLFTSVSAPVYAILPALLLHWYLGLAPPTPATLALALAIVLLPERGISFAYTAIRDPAIEFSWPRSVEAVAFAYLWIVFAWITQLHSLYLQLSGTEGVWHRTKKMAGGG